MNMEQRIIDWLLSDNTGASSKCMLRHLLGKKADKSEYPHDSGDFLRCVGLLNAAPELRPLLPKMGEVNKYWAALVKEWDRLDAIQSKTELYNEIKEIIEPLHASDRNFTQISPTMSVRWGDPT